MIPKIIHYCWLGGNPLPKSAKRCIKSWRKYCPDYEIIEWNESNYDFTKNQYMKEAFEAKKWGFVPDYARLDIIYQYGGIYLDVDVEMIRPFDSLLEYSGFAGFEVPGFVALGLGFGATKGNQIIKQMRDDYDNLSFLNADGTYNTVPSPRINTRVLESAGLRCDGSFQLIDNFVFLPMDYLCPKSFDDGIIRKTKNTYAIHHFDGSWHSAEQDIWKKNRWKKGRKDYLIHTPNRFLKKLLGENKYNQLKGFLKQKKGNND